MTFTDIQLDDERLDGSVWLLSFKSSTQPVNLTVQIPFEYGLPRASRAEFASDFLGVYLTSGYLNPSAGEILLFLDRDHLRQWNWWKEIGIEIPPYLYKPSPSRELIA
jgi:hypothetical protein